MKYRIFISLLSIPTTTETDLTTVVATTNTIVLGLFASTVHAQDILFVLGSVSEVDLHLPIFNGFFNDLCSNNLIEISCNSDLVN